MSWLLILAALWVGAGGDRDGALVLAVLAVATAVLRLRPGWLGREWNAAIRREQHKTETLFDGRADD